MSRHKPDDLETELLIREVDEDLQQERMRKLWQRYGGWFISAAVALVLVVAGWQGISTWRANAQSQAGRMFSKAMDLLADGKTEEGRMVLEALVADAPAGYRLVATLKLADIRAKGGDLTGAVALYSALPQTSDSAPYEALATLKAAYLQLGTDQFAEAAKMVDKLAQEHNPWRFSAWEIQALAALQQGDNAAASALWRRIVMDPATPAGLRTRAEAMLDGNAS